MLHPVPGYDTLIAATDLIGVVVYLLLAAGNQLPAVRALRQVAVTTHVSLRVCRSILENKNVHTGTTPYIRQVAHEVPQLKWLLLWKILAMGDNSVVSDRPAEMDSCCVPISCLPQTSLHQTKGNVLTSFATPEYMYVLEMMTRGVERRKALRRNW